MARRRSRGGRTRRPAASLARPEARGSGARRLRPIVAGALLLCCASWSSEFEQQGARLRNKRLGYSIEWPGSRVDPAVGASAPSEDEARSRWKPIRVEGAALSFRSTQPDASTLTMLVQCGRRVRPELEARHLRIGLPQPVLRYSAPASHLGHPGWGQSFETEQDGRRVYVSAMSLQVGDCVYDWLLVSGREPGPDQDVFEAWWSSFRPPPRAATAGDLP